jgi:hypothetical protein
MTRLPRSACFISFCLTIMFPLLGGCDGTGDEDVNAPKIPGGVDASLGPHGRGPMGGGPSSSPIKAIMVKLNKGPNGLGILLDTELKAENPAWETIQPRANEYAQLAHDLVKEEPARGSKESWAKLAAAYAESAKELDKAAQAKDLDAARDANTELGNSCMACHRQHRGGPGMGGPGMGGPGGPRGGPRGGGQPKFGMPPGGLPPGGSPPAGPGEPPK